MRCPTPPAGAKRSFLQLVSRVFPNPGSPIAQSIHPDCYRLAKIGFPMSQAIRIGGGVAVADTGVLGRDLSRNLSEENYLRLPLFDKQNQDSAQLITILHFCLVFC